MITENFVSFETAKLLKEKGFDVPCDSYYEWFESNVTLYKGHVPEFSKSNINHNQFGDRISRSSQSLALKWLREVYNLHITIKPYITEEGIMYLFEIYKLEAEKFTLIKTKTGFEKCEEAAEFTIRYALENLI